MRKKCITFLLAVTLTSSMLLTACGSTETESSGGKTETETEAPADDGQSSKTETEADDVSTEEDAVEEVKETHEPYTADDVTDEMMQELYSSIKDSVTTEYLEPNNISSADFKWPQAENYDWTYFYDDLYQRYSISLATGSEFEIPESSTYIFDPNNKEILDSAFKGIMNFFTSCEPYEGDFYNTIAETLRNDHSLIVNNVTFD